MPIYEFACRQCGNEFEKIVSFSAKGAPNCPQCGSDQVERHIGLPALHFKGSGFYINDSKASSKADASKGADAGDSAAADGDANTSSDGDTKKKADAATGSEGQSTTADKPAQSAEKREKPTASPATKSES